MTGNLIAGIPTPNKADAEAASAQRKAVEDAAALDALEITVHVSMQTYFNDPANSRGLPIKVYDVVLVKLGGSLYEGMAAMTAGDGTRRDIPIHVTADGRSMMWETEPGALLPLLK